MRSTVQPLSPERRAENRLMRAEFSAAVRGASSAERQALAAAEIQKLQAIDIAGLSPRDRKAVQRRWLAALRNT
jgi:hypothetical protein